MKKISSIMFLLALLASSCSEDELVKNQPSSIDTLKFTASFEGNDSRTYIEEGNLLRWTAGDQITLFVANTLNRQYQFDGKTGANSGTFSIVNNPFGTGNDLNCHYAVYPYASDIEITEKGVITATLPAKQNYAENSFGSGHNTMVAVTQHVDDTFLKFKNVGGYLKLQLYGDDVTVKSITLTGNNNEKLAGKATITASYSGSPAVNMTGDATEKIVLDCGEGVKIGTTEETATAFWLVVPPVTFENGFTITVTDSDEKYFIKSTSTELSIDRNIIQPLTASEVNREDFVYDALSLPDGQTFNSIVSKFLEANSNLTKIKFIANSHTTSESVLVTDEDGTKGYIVENGDYLEIHSSAKEFLADNDCSRMFEGLSNLISIELSNLNTLNVTSMAAMFRNCSSLTSLDLSNFNTSNVTSMTSMFQDCSGLTSLDVSSFNTSNVKYMGSMFQNCSGLTTLDVSNFNTLNVRRMIRLFDGCSALTSLDVSKFNTSNVTDMSSMFYACSGLTTLDVSNFNTSNVTNMYAMFFGCSLLTSLDLSSFNTEKVTDMTEMFRNCLSLKSLDIRSFETSKTSSMYGMFYSCNNLISLDVSNFDTSNVTSMGRMFNGCSGLTSLDVSGFDTSNVTDMSWMFSGCTSLTSLDLNSFSFKNDVVVSYMFEYIGSNASNKPIPIKVTETGYAYLNSKDTYIYDGYAKLVQPSGEDW